MTFDLNRRAKELVDGLVAQVDQLRITNRRLPSGAQVFDFGVEVEGGLQAGVMLARICMAGLCEVSINSGSIDGQFWPQVMVTTDAPVAACLLSQYAGWQISVGKFFAMGSGPMRAAAAREELFSKLEYSESPADVVGVLETGRLPGDAVIDFISERTTIPASNTVLLAAPTSSQSGNVQVVARSVETAMHKLFELGFDVNRVASGWGIAPLPPVAADDLAGIGRTNDAILYGGQVILWVHGDDESLIEIGPRVPANSSEAHGKPFLEIFQEAGGDFYKIDPHLFSPAEITFQNLDTGRVHRFGRVEPAVLRKSFGWE